MATWKDVSRIVAALPETTEDSTGTTLGWRVKKKPIAWERPLRKGDLAALGQSAPTGPILGAWVPDVGAKEALLSDAPEFYFTTPHFDGYPAVLVRLDEIPVAELEELLVEAWLAQAPKRLAAAYLGDADR